MTAPTFTEDWFGVDSCDALAAIVRGVANVPGRLVEIGAWEGRSTIAMAVAAWPRLVHSIDTWAGSPGEISAELAAERDVFTRWKANIKAATKGNVIPHRGDWRDHVPHVDEPIALAFIDAEHTYTEVHDTLTELLPKMAPGGIICGDDAHHRPVQQAVLEVLGSDVFTVATMWLYQVPKADIAPDLAREYARLCATPSDIVLHLPRFVAMVEAMNAQHVIELGSRTGVSTVAWLYALAKTGGRLTSVDLDAAPAAGDHDHWTHIQGNDESPEVFAQLEPADIVFIDTSHHYEHTARELHLYRQLVKPGGLIVCHDTELPLPEGAPKADPLYPVKRAIERFTAETGDTWTNITECYGLGIIKVEA
jgi:predicted O-methyltransferase YrrM